MEGFGGTTSWESIPFDPIHVLLKHSDCDGFIEVKDLLPLADRLDGVTPLLRMMDILESGDTSPLHAPKPEMWFWTMEAKAERFAAGLRKAASLQERVEFY